VNEAQSHIDWYEAETPTRIVMIAELQRLVRRMRVRPLPVILMAAIVTAGITYKVATKPRIYTADLVLAVNEGALGSNRDKSIPFEQLKEYVASVLLPDTEVSQVIEKFYPGRIATVGAPFALESFRDKVNVTIWKNSFVYYHEYDANARKSARIGIEVTDEDPDRAFEVARDLASVVIRTHEEQRRKVSTTLAGEVALARETMGQRVDDLGKALAVKQTALVEANKRRNTALAAALTVDITALMKELASAEDQLGQIAASPDLVADRIAAARLGTTVSVVDQVRPERIDQSEMVLAMVIAVVAVGSLIGSTLVLGAFDTRVHEVEDVARLGLPILGHLPGFRGDDVGSLAARGGARARVPSYLGFLPRHRGTSPRNERWRSPR
jgi:capsular polysaccharide biosynthesis protein